MSDLVLPLTATPVSAGGMYTTLAPGAEAAPSAATASQVLDQHAQLRDLLASPNRAVLSIAEQFGRWSDQRPDQSWLSRFMFWPYRMAGREPDGWAAQFLAGIARDLAAADTYQVTAPMCDLAGAVYEQTAAQDSRIGFADLPSESGFLWLDKPWRRTDAAGRSYQIRAVTWGLQSTRWDGHDCAEDGVRITVWSDWGADPAAAREWATLDEKARRALGPLTMGFTCVIPFGAASSGEEAGQVPTPLHYVQALWLLMGTELAASAPGAVIRQARRRALRTLARGDVSVITLRRAARGDGSPGGQRDVDWSCRWLVRGFWRHIDGYGTVGRFHEAIGDHDRLCIRCRARVRWVRPHVRGPDDRPLRASRAVMYRLSR